MDKPSTDAVRWAKSALVYIEAAKRHLEEASHELRYKRTHPAPEWREAQRLLKAVEKLIEETL